jgi:hypothetical protein
MPNPNGTPDALVPAPQGNTRRLVHGAYSPRFRSERQDEIVAELMALPHVTELDLPAAREIAALTEQAERVSEALSDGRVESTKGEVRALLEHRRRLSAQLLVLFEAFGMTPRARQSWVRRAALPTVAEEIQRRRALYRNEADEP